MAIPNSEQDSFARSLGIVLVEKSESTAICEMVIGQSHLNAAGFTHGGVVFALADAAAASAFNSPGDLQLTVNASINFLRATKEGDVLRAVATVKYSGRKIGSCQIEVESGGRLIATLLAQSARVSVGS